MQLYVCGGKQTQGNNTMYLLRDVRSNKETVVDGNKLKDAMRSKKVDVMNLTLTSDNRLVEASKDKMAQLSGLLRAPYSLIDILEPLNTNHLDCVESIMDEIIQDSIEAYVKENKKYVKISNINKENNTFVLEFTLGLNSYVMCHYDRIVYGELGKQANNSMTYKDDIGAICFDVGIQVLAISNRRASSKIGDGTIFKASESIIRTKWVDGSAIRLNYKLDSNNKLTWNDGDIQKLKEQLGRFILNNVSQELMYTCENNPDIANNTNIYDYIKYDEAKKEYVKSVTSVTGAGLGVALLITAISALSMITNPEIVQTGILAEIAQLGTVDQIFKAILTYSAGSGAIQGAIASVGVIGNAGGFSWIKDSKEKFEDAKKVRDKDMIGAFKIKNNT